MPWDRTKGMPEPVRILDRVRTKDNGEPLVDLRVVAPEIKIMRDQTIPWCRERVAEMARRAALSLPPGFGLGVTDAWRPFERQKRIYQFMWESARVAFPDRPFASLRRTVNRFVAPPHRKAPPGHCTGGALDVNLLDHNKEVIDVSAPFERFQAAPTYTFGLTKEAEEHRMILVDAMLGAGFSNCRDEWWHYSYGDAGWVIRAGAPEAIYCLAELDASQYEEQERLAEEAMKERPNPWLPQK